MNDFTAKQLKEITKAEKILAEGRKASFADGILPNGDPCDQLATMHKIVSCVDEREKFRAHVGRTGEHCAGSARSREI